MDEITKLEEPTRLGSFGYGLGMLLVGAMMIVLPFVTWPNSKIFAVLYSPGLLMGPYFLYGSVGFFREAFSRREE